MTHSPVFLLKKDKPTSKDIPRLSIMLIIPLPVFFVTRLSWVHEVVGWAVEQNDDGPLDLTAPLKLLILGELTLLLSTKDLSRLRGIFILEKQILDLTKFTQVSKYIYLTCALIAATSIPRLSKNLIILLHQFRSASSSSNRDSTTHPEFQTQMRSSDNLSHTNGCLYKKRNLHFSIY